MPRKTKPKIEFLALDNKLNGQSAILSCSLEERGKIIEFNESAKLVRAMPSGPPIARLVDGGKIGGEEMQAAQEIERAFMALAGGLFIRPLNMERVDGRGGHPDWPHALSEIVAKYQRWADFWSVRRKQLCDHTLEITIAAVVDERHVEAISRDLGFSTRKVTKAVIGGLRDYAARANLVSDSVAARWKAESLETFARSVHNG